jgi:DNA-binding NtrC family response regulator/tetratricopeptide (TPR) repeat protein
MFREAPVQLIADRFVIGVAADDRWPGTSGCGQAGCVDLASGSRLQLIVRPEGDAAEQRRWAARCGGLALLRHPALAVLIDYGVFGQGTRFEAWRATAPWRGSRTAAAVAAARVSTLMAGCGLTSAALSGDSVWEDMRRPVVIPDETSGLEAELGPAEQMHEAYGSDSLAIEIVGRQSVVAISDGFAVPARHPGALGLWGPAGSGLDTALLDIARAARVNGYLPIASDVDPRLAALAGGRTQLLIVRSEPRNGWTQWLHAVMRSPRPHRVLFCGVQAVDGVETLGLEPCPPESLIAAVKPVRLTPAAARRVAAAARRAHGLPARFARLLWRQPAIDRGRLTAPRAAERAPAYGGDASDLVTVAPAASSSWSTALAETPWRRRMESGIELLADGRRAPGERTLREAIGALARRRDWEGAARGSLALASALLARGRTRDAVSTLDDAQRWAAEARRPDLLVGVALTAGVAAVDELRLDAAEVLLSGARDAAAALGSPASEQTTALGLARCLFWRGRYDEAAALAAGPVFDTASAEVRVRQAALRARIAIGLRDFAAATASAAEAQHVARQLVDARLTIAAATARAFVHLALGDYRSAQEEAGAAVHAARAIRDPLAGVRARLVASEAARRRSNQAEAIALLDPVRRLAGGALPPILRDRCALQVQLLTDAAVATGGRLAELVNGSGLKALALYCEPPTAVSPLAGSVADVVEILHCCQSAEDDRAVLATLCGRLRDRLLAAGVAWFVDDRGTAVLAIGAGSRVDSAIAERAIALDGVIPPHRLDERLEGAAAVKYGGRTVGALVARWALGSRVDSAAAAALLSTAAAAAGPAVAALAAARSAPPTAPWELLGASAAADEVRRAIERAAAAPYPVLVEGESGSGKELVARALHRRGPRRERPFCTVNCAALPDDLVESELFGHARGAFTGALAERPGVFEEAHGGTLFLDEIGELSLRAQAKVLRTIQEGEVRRVGENLPRRVDVRVVAATNRDLRQEVANARFRLDLLYRLDVLRIAIPPLRDRRDDVPLLAEHFWREASGRLASRATLAAATVAALARYDWPGNVRELQNVLAAMAVRAPKRGTVPPSALPPQFDGARPDASYRLDEARRTFERRFIRAALARSGGHRARAAEELGVTRQGLTKLMARLGIDGQA